MTSRVKIARSDDGSATLYLRSFAGQAVSAEPVKPSMRLEGDSIVVEFGVITKGGKVKDLTLGLLVYLGIVYDLVPSGYLLDLGNIRAESRTGECKGIYTVKVNKNNDPSKLYVFLSVAKVGNTTMKIIIHYPVNEGE